MRCRLKPAGGFLLVILPHGKAACGAMFPWLWRKRGQCVRGLGAGGNSRSCVMPSRLFCQPAILPAPGAASERTVGRMTASPSSGDGGRGGVRLRTRALPALCSIRIPAYHHFCIACRWRERGGRRDGRGAAYQAGAQLALRSPQSLLALSHNARPWQHILKRFLYAVALQRLNTSCAASSAVILSAANLAVLSARVQAFSSAAVPRQRLGAVNHSTKFLLSVRRREDRLAWNEQRAFWAAGAGGNGALAWRRLAGCVFALSLAWR